MNTKTSFFIKEKTFYKSLFGMLAFVALQNVVAYSVNMADNIMLGSYSQAALSGAATVNQVFFMIQQFAISFGNTLVAISAQYWGQKRVNPIKKLTGNALKIGFAITAILTIICLAIPEGILKIFTNESDIIFEGKKYLLIIVWTFILYIFTNIFMAALRAVGTVNISFYISIVSLVINVGINYVLIFGKLGFPEMGIVGAAIGTLIARIVELLIVLFYLIFIDKKLYLFKNDEGKFSLSWLISNDKNLWIDYLKIYLPIMCATVLWGVSVPMQTAILGHLSADAIAANSVATTFYQYLKVIVIAMSSTSAVMIGQATGKGDYEEVKAVGRTLSIIDVGIGVVLGILLIVLKNPLLSLYKLNPSATSMAGDLILLMSIIMVGMSYQMPVSFGIFQGAGDAKFAMIMNLVCTWGIVMPFSFMAAFWWKLPVVWVVLIIQSDQIFKGLPTFIHFRKYTWIKKLTRDDA